MFIVIKGGENISKIVLSFSANVKPLLVILFSALLVTVAFYVFSPSPPVATALTPRASIHILGNGDFTSVNGVVGGEGTFSDPYIIEGWDISAASNHGIWIEYTTAYFVVRNCYVHEGAPNYHGVSLYQVFNGRVENVESSWNLWGLTLIDSGSEGNGNTIADCYVHENWWSGIYLYKSNYTTLKGNVLTNTGEYGVQTYMCSNNEFTNNKATNCSSGFKLQMTENSTFTGNTVEYNTYGIDLTLSRGNTFTSNVANNNNEYGIYLSSSTGNTLTANTANNNDWNGICLSITSDGNTLNGNTAEYNYYGIRLDFCGSGNTIIGNIANNNYWGIWIHSSSGITLTSNTANNNTADGIFLYSCYFNTLNGNTAENNGAGIHLAEGCSNNTLTANSANNNDWNGIWLDSSNNTLTSNIANNNLIGIELYNSDFSSSDANVLNGNTANNNEYGIRLNSFSDDNKVVLNTCYFNSVNDISNSGTGNFFQYNSYDTSSGV